ncbi:MAG: DUF4974 domain-containing protein [Chitinophagaceae bacterium]|jgi:ferric-dicitrate binding protein FerR (iron transport regulator)|nr:DUF4974 domain-containing protein [Chitinophagaceae bacterium]
MHIPEKILGLIEKFQNGTITPGEKNLLDEWYNSKIDHTVHLNEDLTEEQLSGRIKNRLLETIEINNHLIKRKSGPNWKIMAAASIILILISVSAYFIISYKLPGKEIVKHPPAEPLLQNDLAPGGNKAILTLADGSTVILDSASDGTITQQGNIKIQKLGNGLLVYTINGKQVSENDEAFFNTISTPRGGQYNVTLSDGSKVWLNAASSIRFPVAFIGKERKVEIKGEAYFEVAGIVPESGQKMPFIVKIISASGNTGEIEVMGTHFNVNAYDDEDAVKTTLLEGRVKISLPEIQKNPSYKILKPGQQAGISKKGKLNVIEHADTEEAVAWKNGRFQFKSADLKTILRQMSRWYDVDIIYKDYVDKPFTGQLPRNANASKMFELLTLTGEVNFKIEGKKIIVSH